MNLNALESRFFRICCSRFGVGLDRRAAASGRASTAKSQALVVARSGGTCARRSRCSSAKQHRPDVHVHRARLDLRQVEDVVDQRRAGRCPTSGWSRRTRPACRSGCPPGCRDSSLRQDQQAVERRAQLVRHVGEELGLVLRGQRQLLGLLFQRRPRPVRSRGSSSRPRRSAPRAAPPSPRAPRWSAAALPAAASAAPRTPAACAPAARAASLVSVSSSCCVCSSSASDCDCFSSSSVRMVASIVFRTMPMLSVSCRGTSGGCR